MLGGAWGVGLAHLLGRDSYDLGVGLVYYRIRQPSQRFPAYPKHFVIKTFRQNKR